MGYQGRNLLERSWDFVGSGVVAAAGTFAAAFTGAAIYSLGAGLAGAIGLGTGLSVIAGGLAVCVAAAPVVVGAVFLGGVTTAVASAVSGSLGMQPNGWGVTTGIAAGLAATFSMVSGLTSGVDSKDSMLQNTMPETVVAANDTASIAEDFAAADQGVIKAGHQYFTTYQPAAALMPRAA